MRTARDVALLGMMAGCLVAGGCGSTGRHGSPDRQKLKLASRSANYAPNEEAGWAHMQSLGIRYVFIAVPAADQVEAVQAKLAEYQLTPVVMRGSADLTQDSAVEELAAQIATCRRMGVDYMFLSVKAKGPDKGPVYARLRRAGDEARKHGVTLVLETHPEFGTNGDVHVETMRQIDHPNVRVNFDTGNITYYNRDTTAVAELEKAIAYVATVEIKDHNGEFETWNFPAFGKGAVDIPGVMRVLRRHGYRGPITIEIEGVKGTERNAGQVKQDIEESVRYLRSIDEFE